jgi:hypothetical protein
MTVQISQRGKQYLKTAETLLRAVQTMTDPAIAGLRPLPTITSSEPRMLRMLMRPKHSLDRLPTPKTSGHDLMGNSIAHPSEDMPGDVGMPAGGPVTRRLVL